jgi:hypothetical protein
LHFEGQEIGESQNADGDGLRRQRKKRKWPCEGSLLFEKVYPERSEVSSTKELRTNTKINLFLITKLCILGVENLKYTDKHEKYKLSYIISSPKITLFIF